MPALGGRSRCPGRYTSTIILQRPLISGLALGHTQVRWLDNLSRRDADALRDLELSVSSTAPAAPPTISSHSLWDDKQRAQMKAMVYGTCRGGVCGVPSTAEVLEASGHWAAGCPDDPRRPTPYIARHPTCSSGDDLHSQHPIGVRGTPWSAPYGTHTTSLQSGPPVSAARRRRRSIQPLSSWEDLNRTGRAGR